MKGNHTKQTTKIFEALLHTTTDGVVVTDFDQDILEVNDAFSSLFGKSRQDLRSTNLLTLLGQLDTNAPDRWIDLVKLARNERDCRGIDFQIVSPEGDKQFAVNISILEGENDVILSIWRNIGKTGRTSVASGINEQKFKELFNNMPSGVAVYKAIDNGEDFVIADFNRAAEQIENIKKEDLLGKEITEVFPGVKEFGLFDVIQRVWKTEIPEQYPVSFYKDNRIAGWRDNYVYKMPTGEVVAVYKDVTEAMQAREALEKSEERHRILVTNSLTGIYVRSADKLLFINRRLAEIFGYSQDELMGTPFLELIHPDDRKTAMERAALRMAGEIPSGPFDVRLKTKSGETRWVEIIGSRIEYQGKTAIMGNFVDITERKRAEKELLSARDDLKNIFESISDAIMVLDADQRILDANMKALSDTQLPKEEIIGRHCYEVCHKSALPGKACPHRRLLSSKDLTPQEKQVEIGGKISIVTVAPVLNREGKLIKTLHIAKDITEHKRLEDQLRQSQKMEAIGQLAGGVAHDFNNLLTAIMGHTQLALLKMPKGSPTREDLITVETAAKSAADLTQQLLTFSRKQVIEPRVLNINRTIDDMRKMLRRLIRENIELHTKMDPMLRHVMADPGQMEQVLVNLVVNARDAIPSKGRIVVETKNIDLDDNNGKDWPAIQPGQYVMLRVSDDGQGMSAEVRAHIFEPFFTTKDESGGTGLGLATVYGIVKQHGGHIQVFGEEGQGTIFEVYLPVADAEHERRGPDIEKVMPKGTETVLVVEDETSVREMAVKILSELGYRVFDASDGTHAIKMLEKLSLTPALLVTDLVMPEMGGEELAQKLSRRFPNMKTLFTTGYTRGDMDSGAGVLQKPYTPSVLAEEVRHILDKEESEISTD